MAAQPTPTPSEKPQSPSEHAVPDEFKKPWGTKTAELSHSILAGLYGVARSLDKDTRLGVGLDMRIPVFIQDPLLADNPLLGLGEIQLRLDSTMGDGPTSSRLAVVDYNFDTKTLREPLVWSKENGWFHTPAGDWLPNIPSKEIVRNQQEYQTFLAATVKNPYFHQLNVWGIAQQVLEFYEDPLALGRPVPWGFDGNRLILVPHAGYGENAFYDQTTKSIQFLYFGDIQNPGYTCLSHDIVAHETGHAVLDGIRPLFNENPSLQTAAFHEFVGDLTAILLALANTENRQFVAKETAGDLEKAFALADLAEQFGAGTAIAKHFTDEQGVDKRPYLRTAINKLHLQDPAIRNSLSAHTVSQVMTGAMFDILIAIARMHMDKNKSGRKVSPKQALAWAAPNFKQIALQPLDLCPPCDIQFIDYAQAVIRNHLLVDPLDPNKYRSMMLEAFHKRGLCGCQFKKATFDTDHELPQDCLFQDALSPLNTRFVAFDVARMAGSRTAAYYFLNNNRDLLHIPPHYDIVVADLYDNSKFTDAGKRQPRQVILEYIWQEEVEFTTDDFKWLKGKKVQLYCGGTLVFDERGNLLSWFRKPGTQHIAPDVANPTHLQSAAIADLKAGKLRRDALLAQYSSRLQRGLVGLVDGSLGSVPREAMKPVTAFIENDVVHFVNTPHLRKADLDTEDQGWLTNY